MLCTTVNATIDAIAIDIVSTQIRRPEVQQSSGEMPAPELRQVDNLSASTTVFPAALTEGANYQYHDNATCKTPREARFQFQQRPVEQKTSL